MKGFEVIHYDLFGLHLQEPNSLIYNWLVAVLCFVWFLKLTPNNEFVKNWRYFFLTFSITCFFAGFAHSLFGYFGIYGKMPHWVGGIISGYFVGKAMLSLLEESKIKSFLMKLLVIKLVSNILLALSLVTFTFVLIDSAITYIIYCAGISIYRIKRDRDEYKIFVFGVVASFCGALSFVFKLDISIYFNREDISHVFVLISLILFYIGTKKIETKEGLALA